MILSPSASQFEARMRKAFDPLSGSLNCITCSVTFLRSFI